MLTVDEAIKNIGNKVIYDRPYCRKEIGTMTSVNEIRKTAFVKYENDINSKCTNLEDLNIIKGENTNEGIHS